MVKAIKLNLVEIEAMLYFWQAVNDREKVAETYLYEVASLPGLSSSYDTEFDAMSVRKVLSAITNKELLSTKTQREGRFWNYNMWMMEDLSLTNAMVTPLKRLNIDDLAATLNSRENKKAFEELQVIFSPLSTEEYLIKENQLIVNFFRLKVEEDGQLTVGNQNVKEYIQAKLVELMN